MWANLPICFHFFGRWKRLDANGTSLNTQRLSEMMATLEGSSVTMFHMLPVEESCWWLPVLRYGENCLGAPAFRSREFTYVFVEIIEGMIAEGASRGPSAA